MDMFPTRPERGIWKTQRMPSSGRHFALKCLLIVHMGMLLAIDNFRFDVLG